jgi:hypothetical protein
MGDSRRHRRPHPQDAELFAPETLGTLNAAVTDLSWLRARGYAEPSAIKLVGDRYQLRQRQRVAVGRCACSNEKRDARWDRQVSPSEIAGSSLAIDGLNVITTIEVALAHGVLLLGRDRCLRDMASFHGSYRLVHETERAVTILVEVVESLGARRAVVYLDRPVSNSGRLAESIRSTARREGSELEALTAHRVDELLIAHEGVVASADSAVLDGCRSWLNLARIAVERYRDEVEPMWLLDLSSP